MLLIRKSDSTMDFEFQRKFFDISSQYKEVAEEDPRLLCQASWNTAEYINDNLPGDLYWDNGIGILIDRCNDNYKDCEIVEIRGSKYAVCPEAYEMLDDLLPEAIEEGLKRTFGHATKLEDE